MIIDSIEVFDTWIADRAIISAAPEFYEHYDEIDRKAILADSKKCRQMVLAIRHHRQNHNWKEEGF